jgi:threonylcarbamoyladenosine tRNA methylthiotransferase MtaB
VSYLHVFTYSERANTPAVAMEGVVPMNERKRRNNMLSILSEKKRLAFYREHLHTIRPVLFEQHSDAALLSGYTDNYIKVDMPGPQALINQVRAVQLLDINAAGLMQVFLPEHQGKISTVLVAE